MLQLLPFIALTVFAQRQYTIPHIICCRLQQLRNTKNDNLYHPPILWVFQDLVSRARAHGVASIEWSDVDGIHLATAAGFAEQASHVETNVMQAVQEAVVMA